MSEAGKRRVNRNTADSHHMPRTVVGRSFIVLGCPTLATHSSYGIDDLSDLILLMTFVHPFRKYVRGANSDRVLAKIRLLVVFLRVTCVGGILGRHVKSR